MHITGHRGQVMRDGPPENSVAAVDAALCAGADGVEVDVRLSADDVPVCVHDADLVRIAGIPAQVRQLTYEQLRALRLPGEHRVDKLSDVAQVVRGRGTLLVEVKHDFGSPPAYAATAAMRVLAALATGPDIVISSFSGAILDDVRRLDPRARRALVTGRGVPAIVGLAEVLSAGHSELHAHVTTVLADHGVVERAGREGVAVRCWTVNRALDARLLDIAGVAGVITDDPGALRTAITARPSVSFAAQEKP